MRTLLLGEFRSISYLCRPWSRIFTLVVNSSIVRAYSRSGRLFHADVWYIHIATTESFPNAENAFRAAWFVLAYTCFFFFMDLVAESYPDLQIGRNAHLSPMVTDLAIGKCNPTQQNNTFTAPISTMYETYVYLNFSSPHSSLPYPWCKGFCGLLRGLYFFLIHEKFLFSEHAFSFLWQVVVVWSNGYWCRQNWCSRGAWEDRRSWLEIIMDGCPCLEVVV